MTAQTVRSVVRVIRNMKKCDAVALACTELPIIITEKNCPLLFVDTTRLLGLKALEYAMD